MAIVPLMSPCTTTGPSPDSRPTTRVCRPMTVRPPPRSPGISRGTGPRSGSTPVRVPEGHARAPPRQRLDRDVRSLVGRSDAGDGADGPTGLLDRHPVHALGDQGQAILLRIATDDDAIGLPVQCDHIKRPAGDD